MGCCPGRTSNPSPSCGTNCFRANNYAVACADSAGPCGGTGSKDLTTVNTSFNGCSNGDGDCGVTYQLVSYTSHFSSVTISEDGLVEWTLSDSAEPNNLGTIRYRVFCNCSNLSATAKIFVCVKDLCANTIVTEGFECDKCTGELEPIVPNAILS